MSADEIAWRKVKDQRGVYVHLPESHVYPGSGGWDEALCSTNDHAGCQAERVKT